MTELYGRAMRIRVTPKRGGDAREWSFDEFKNPRGFDMEANIDRDDTADPDEAEITLYGIDDEDMGLLFQKGDLFVEVFASLGGTETRRFAGDVDASSVVDAQNPPDAITTFKAGSNRDVHRFERVDEGFDQPNITAAAIVQRICANAGISTGPIPSQLTETRFPRGFQARGPWRDVMGRVCRAAGVRMINSDDLVYFVAPGETMQELTPLLVAGTQQGPGTGLLGTPRWTKDKVEFDALIMPGLWPGRKVQIQSPTFSGAVKLKRVSESLNTSDANSFVCSCEGVAL